MYTGIEWIMPVLYLPLYHVSHPKHLLRPCMPWYAPLGALSDQVGSVSDLIESVCPQNRLPGLDWKERHGAAGVDSYQRRSSPIVEISLILV